MKDWNIDANNIDLHDINTGQLNNYMVRTREIDDFLSPDTKKMFIVAPKGLGKTYLLKVKSQLFRESKSGYKFIPHNSLCEKFTNNDFSFSQKDLTKFNDIGIWKKTWEIALYTLILKSFNEAEIPKDIKNIIGKAGSLAEIIGTLLQSRNRIVNLHNLVASDLKPTVRKLKEESSANQVAIFIDNIDEAFDEFVGYNAKNGSHLSANIWINAQLSILFVAKDICSINRHVKIFLTIRSEAYNNNQDPQRLQLDDISVILKYTKQQIKEIFFQNILLTPQKDLAAPNNDNLITRFLGYDKIKHKFVEDRYGNKIEESFFDFMYRHTYGRPREIVLMGRSIVERVSSNERHKTDFVGTVVNDISYELFEQLKREIIPIFEDEIFEELSKRVEHNVIRHNEVETINKEVNREFNFNDVFSYFYRLGLIGIVDNVTDGNGGYKKQTFLPVGQYTLLEDKIPICDFYVLHPTINKKMKQTHDVGYYDRFNIIGYENKFNPQIQKVLENHLHFGLDRDSITVMLPELSHSKCIATIILPSPEWRDLENTDTFVIELNGVEHSFKVFRDSLTSEKKTDILDEWRNKRFSVLLYTRDIEEISKFYKNAISITVCLYTPYLDILIKLTSNENNKKRYIYYCIREFIEKDFLKFKNNFDVDNSRIIIEPVIIDRYQYSQSIQYNSVEKLLICIVNCENYCKIICKDRPGSTLRNYSTIQKYSDEKSFEYNLQVKNYIVEGIYQFFKTLKYNSVALDEEIFNKLIDIFSKIQIYRIYNSIKEFDEDTLHTIFLGKSRQQIQQELKAFSLSTLDRIVKFFNTDNFTNNESNVSSNKEKGIFPIDEVFFAFVSNHRFYEKEEISLLYMIYEYLEVKHSDSFKSIFISYSSKDSDIATIIEKKLSVIGVKVKIFSKDNPHRLLERYMIESVKNNDKMLFLASKNSLTSDACHIELTTCRDLMRRNNDKSRLVAIRLDDYVLKTDEFDISDRERIDNFKMLKEYFMSKYYNTESEKDVIDMKLISQNIDDLIKDALRK